MWCAGDRKDADDTMKGCRGDMFWAARGNRPLVAGIPRQGFLVCPPRQAYYLPREARPAMAGIPTVPLMAGILIFHGA